MKGKEGRLDIMQPSLLDRVKATLQRVFARYPLSDEHADVEASSPASPVPNAPNIIEPPAPPGTEGVTCEPGKRWLTPTQREILQQVARSSTAERRIGDRAHLLLRFDSVQTKKGVARSLSLDIKTVRKWCARWEEVRDVLSPLERRTVPRQAYRRVIEAALKDAPRSGAPLTFTAEQVAHIVAMACERLDDSDGPVSHWTTGHLAAEAVERQIATSISSSSVGRF